MNSYYRCAYCSITFTSDSVEFVCDKCKTVDRSYILSEPEDRSDYAESALNNLLALASEMDVEVPESVPESDADMDFTWTEEDAIHSQILADIANKIKRPDVLMPLTISPPSTSPTSQHEDKDEDVTIPPPLERYETGIVWLNGRFKSFKQMAREMEKEWEEREGREICPPPHITRQNTIMTYDEDSETFVVVNGNPDGSRLMPNSNDSLV